MDYIYKTYTKEKLEQTMKEQQGVDFLNFINDMLQNGWSLSKIDKAKIMTKKAIRERMKKMNAFYDSSISQYVMQDSQTTDTNGIQNEYNEDSNRSINVSKEDIKPLINVHKKDEKEIQQTQVNLSTSNVELLQNLEIAMKQLTKQMAQLNQNGVKVNGSVSPASVTGSNSNEFIAKRFDKDDQLINRNHRFYESVLRRLNAFHDDHPQYNLQQTINSLLSEALERYNY
ncbi:hypothetical protein GMB80_14325 [Turicibacter sanguinis]|nr:hypothetical protein [Turicibacter sanguinis]MTP74109.1 hypothetical protein [Turicibacter sanguinis]